MLLFHLIIQFNPLTLKRLGEEGGGNLTPSPVVFPKMHFLERG